MVVPWVGRGWGGGGVLGLWVLYRYLQERKGDVEHLWRAETCRLAGHRHRAPVDLLRSWDFIHIPSDKIDLSQYFLIFRKMYCM